MRGVRQWIKVLSAWLGVLAVSLFGSQAYADSSAYAPQGQCAGFAAVAVQSHWSDKSCVALVASGQDGLQMPRRILEMAPDQFWIMDMGSWEKRRGRLLYMRLVNGKPIFRTLIKNLDRPLALVRGADKTVYLSEAHTIWRVKTHQIAGPLHLEKVLGDLPDDGAHPLKEITLGASIGGNPVLYINSGSYSDGCRQPDQSQPQPCPERHGDYPGSKAHPLFGKIPRAALLRVVVDRLGGRALTLQPYVYGLRNSLALLTVPVKPSPKPADTSSARNKPPVLNNDIVLQGENSIDYSNAKEPPEELNRITTAKQHFGWPYCVGAKVPSQGYPNTGVCPSSDGPVQLWPAHAAPLHMLIAPPHSGAFTDHVLVAWHGYRPSGQRVMAIKIDEQGMPQAAPQAVLDDWSEKKGVRPRGAPTGMTVDSQGRLWVVEDLNKTVLLVTR